MYRFHLTGPHAGKTIVLGGFQFINGVYTLEATEGVNPSVADAESLASYLGPSYQAFLEGDERLKNEAQTISAQAIVAQTIANKAAEEAGRRAAEQADREAAEQADREAAEQADRKAADEATAQAAKDLAALKAKEDAAAKDKAAAELEAKTKAAAEQQAATEAEANKTTGAEAPQLSERQQKGVLRTALTKLDPENDDHWTDAGLPSVDAVRKLSSNRTVSRADIEQLAPKLDRDEARKAAADPLA